MLCLISSPYVTSAGAMPMVLSTLGTPVEKIVIAAEMSMPRKPQVMPRGSTPKPGAL